MTNTYNLISSNNQWAKDFSDANPDFFHNSAKGQNPHTLWIGCADSRVPESVVTGAQPGEMFVHRNIANQFHSDDTNLLSVLSYAVEHLHIRDVVVVGHTGCGGADACLKAGQSLDVSTAVSGNITTIASHPPDYPLNRWLEPLTRLVSTLPLAGKSHDEALAIVVDANVVMQVENLALAEIIQEAWKKGHAIRIHGWVYDIKTGLIRDLEVCKGPE